MDFDFNDARSSSPYLSAPSTPKRFGELYFSAPNSPARISELYRDLNIPFDWEEKPGTPNKEDDFAFDFSEDLEKASLSADELFDGGQIRPLKPPPRMDEYRKSPNSPKSPRSSIGKRFLQNAFSPRPKKEIDPFAAAVGSTLQKTEHDRGRETGQERERGRGRSVEYNLSSSNSGRRATRSLSPLRVSDELLWEEEQLKLQQIAKQSPINSKPSSSTSSSSKASTSKKWKLKDFLLFRSASEGRATDKDPFKRYAVLKHEELKKNASFRSTDSSGSGSRKRGQVSAHELHYTMNRAVSEDLKKKTFLPYKQGILGRLAFNPAVSALANGFGSLTRG